MKKTLVMLLVAAFSLNVVAQRKEATTNKTTQGKAFIREYYYKASETDSKVSSRQKALTEVKALLMEELGTYVESYVNYQVTETNKQITRDFFTSEIKTLSAGTLETKILAENWNGNEYYMKAEIVADPDEVLRRIHETLSKRKSSEVIDSLSFLIESSKRDFASKSKELEQIRVQLSKQNAEVESKQKSIALLSQQLAKAKQELSVYEARQTEMLSEIEAIELRIANSTKKASSNARMGMTPEEILQVCGRPRSIAGVEGFSEFYNYGNVWVMFEYGIVTSAFEAIHWRAAAPFPQYKENNILKGK